MAALDIELALAEDADAHRLASFARDLIEAGLGGVTSRSGWLR